MQNISSIADRNIVLQKTSSADIHVFKAALSVKDIDDMKVMFVFKHRDQKPFGKNKNHMNLR